MTRLQSFTLTFLLGLLTIHGAVAFVPPLSSSSLSWRTKKEITSSSSSLDSWIGQWQEESRVHQQLVESLFFDNDSVGDGRMLSLHLRGQGRLRVASNRTRFAATTKDQPQTVVFLSTDDQSTESVPSLLLPLQSPGELKLLSFAVAQRSLSKSLLLTLNGLLVNRDGALFDNLPWSSWSVDPQRRNRDAAGNLIDPKFHLGKRDAYYRFMGKDWQGRSAAIGNIALRLKYMLESDNAAAADDDDDDDESMDTQPGMADAKESQIALATRILQLQIRESRMELAGIEAALAASGGGGGEKEEEEEGEEDTQLPPTSQLNKKKAELEQTITDMESKLNQIGSSPKTFTSLIAGMLDDVAKWSTNDGQNAAPYRGAMGYAPILDSKEDINGSLLSYTSPFDLLKEILQDQLNAKVIGCVLENTSLLKGNLVLGGAIVLQRITPQKTSTILGEKVTINDYDEDYGNPGAKGGEVMIVECDSDEAIGMALACNVDLSIGSTLYEMACVLGDETIAAKNSEHILDTLAVWKPTDPEVKLQVEGEQQSSSSSPGNYQSPISIPGEFDDLPSESKALFPTDSPIKSLAEYDQLSNEAKAKLLLELSSFSGRLPRPRVVRQPSESNPLDNLLLPLIDESVRRQFQIRQAEQRGDIELANQLRDTKSRRQETLERAEVARDNDQLDLAQQLESESEFLESLRADITQDEGAYNRFLDRDDWYERDRQAMAQRVTKSMFGTLLDGIE